MSKKQTEILESLLDAKLENINLKLNEINKKVGESLDSLSFMSSQIDGALKRLQQLEEAKKVSDGEVSMLKSKLKESNVNLQSCEEIEIRGIPVSGIKEDAEAIVQQVAECMEVDLRRDDISICHRLPTSNKNTARKPNHPTIIVKFIRRSKREEFYKAMTMTIKVY